jgi:hypothetical protein
VNARSVVVIVYVVAVAGDGDGGCRRASSVEGRMGLTK